MGSTTLYHPVSLHVIRGAAEYCGWKFSKIKQTSASPEKGTAFYVAAIEKMPKGFDILAPITVRRQLQHCFMDDILVMAVTVSRREIWKAYLQVKVTPPDEIAAAMSNSEVVSED